MKVPKPYRMTLLHIKEKFLFWSEYYNHLSTFSCIPLRTTAKKLSIPETYLNPCQTCKMECFAKIVND